MRLALGDEIAQAARIIGLHCARDRWPIFQRLAPAGDLGLALQNSEILDPVEDIEVSEDRAEGRIDQVEGLAVEPRPGLHPCFQSPEAPGQVLALLLEGFRI